MTAQISEKRAVLSFQSRVSYGWVGNRAAEFALQRMGCEVWPVDTVLLSNHPGHGRHRGVVRPADAIADLVTGLLDLGVAPQCDAVLSGYLGHVEVGRAVLDSVKAIRASNPRALYCCDPVMGDRQPGVYVDRELVEFFREDAVPRADIICPNHFELEVLAERALPSLADVKNAALRQCEKGPQIVVVTSVETDEACNGALLTIAVNRDSTWAARTPKLPLAAKGAGDLFTALLLAQILRGRGVTHALAAAVSSTFTVIERTVADNARELAVIATQDALAVPPRWFKTEQL